MTHLSTSAGAQGTAPDPSTRWWPLIRLGAVVALLGLLGLTVLPALKGRPVYEVRNGQIIARSVASTRVIPAGTPVSQAAIVRHRRVMGTITAGYVVGRFDLAGFGLSDLYTDGATQALVFQTSPRPTVLTPGDPDGLLRTWRSNDSGTFRPGTSAQVSPLLLTALLLSLPVLVFLMRSSRITYTWTPDALVVRTAWSTKRFPIGATKASLTTEGLGIRMFGTGAPGYYTGTFSTKTAGGGRVQAMATTTRPKEALLLQLDGTTYYLTPVKPRDALRRFQT